MANRQNQYNFFNPVSVIYMGAQVNSSAIVNICWLIQTFNSGVSGSKFKRLFKPIQLYNVETKSDLRYIFHNTQ